MNQEMLDNMAISEIRAHGPITAADLSLRLGLHGKTETRRRTVRDIVRRLRQDGNRICAEIPGGQNGYWEARDGKEWLKYQQARVLGKKFSFVEIARETRAAQERTDGQQVMFDTRIRKGAFD